VKIQPNYYAEIKRDIKKVIDTLGLSRADFSSATNTAIGWRLFNIVNYDWQYDDNHPAFASGYRVRICQYRPDWKMYSDGLNDTHYTTALNKIVKEVLPC